MKPILLSLLICLYVFAACKAQPAPEKHYTDMIIKGNKIYALTASGHINVFDTNSNKLIDANIHTDTTIISITLDHQGNIVVTDKGEKISFLDEKDLTFKTLAKADGPIYGSVFDSKNHLYAITKEGIVDFQRGTIYYPDTAMFLNHQIKKWILPSAVFMDSQNRIWLGGNHGEWGGTLFIFDTEKKIFVKPQLNGFRIELFPVNTIFEHSKDVYITFSLAHFLTSGAILKFTELKALPVIQSEMYWKDTTEVLKMPEYKGEARPTAMKISIQGEYIGPATYNPADNCIYFYSQNGIFKGNPEHDLSKLDQWTKVANPKLIWTSGQRNAAGPANNMLKMAFAPNGKLYFVSQSDGIGVIDGGKVTMLQ